MTDSELRNEARYKCASAVKHPWPIDAALAEIAALREMQLDPALMARHQNEHSSLEDDLGIASEELKLLGSSKTIQESLQK